MAGPWWSNFHAGKMVGPREMKETGLPEVRGQNQAATHLFAQCFILAARGEGSETESR